MGWLSESKTYVASSAFNLAGDNPVTPNTFAATLVGNILTGRETDLPQVAIASLLGSTAMRQRRFFAWSKDNYFYPTGSLRSAVQVSVKGLGPELRALIAPAAGETLQIVSAHVDDADVEYWAEAWIKENQPQKAEDPWQSDFDATAGLIRITTKHLFKYSFAAPADFLWGIGDTGRRLLFVFYKIGTKTAKGGVKLGGLKLKTYRIGSGTAKFDALAKNKGNLAEFYPPLPLRLHNLSVSQKPTLEPKVRAAFKKLYGTEIDELLAEVEANENIGKIDFCYLVPGVTLDMQGQPGLRYLYAFFKALESYQETDALKTFFAAQVKKGDWDVAWRRWLKANDPDNPQTDHALFGAPSPGETYDLVTEPSLTDLRITVPNIPAFDITLRWVSIEETFHAGNARHFDGDKTRLKLLKGKYWIHGAKLDGGAELVRGDSVSREVVSIFHQTAKHRYSRITIRGLRHINRIYEGRTVVTTGYQALTDGIQSPFVIPLHDPTLRTLSLRDANDLGPVCNYLLCNHVETVKLKWYQTKAFKWALVIGTVALALYTGGASLGATSGILGTNAAVGAALGASAATAAFVGAAVNMVAAMVVTSLITQASTAVFGEKWGAIVGTIASFVALQYGAQYASHGNFAVDWGQMMRVENILQITDAVGGAYNQWLTADTMQLYDEMGEVKDEYEDELKKIQDLAHDNLGMTGGLIDPMLLTNASEHFGETSDTFLGRTLLTGSDIAQLSLAMIEDFATVSLELPQALK
jgi:hypothetical protein